MNVFNAAMSAVFDVLLAPFGHRWVGFDLVVWPVLAGIVALLVYKRLSNQAGIARAKKGIVVNLLEVMLFRDDLLGVLRSTARAMGKNLVYLGHNLLPMAVMLVPMTAIMVQLVAMFTGADWALTIYNHLPSVAGSQMMVGMEMGLGESALTAGQGAAWLTGYTVAALAAGTVATARREH